MSELVICETCEESYARDPQEATVTVTITSPPEAVEQNPAQALCVNHAISACGAYLGFGWSVVAEWKEEA